jgi:hypothetical protein
MSSARERRVLPRVRWNDGYIFTLQRIDIVNKEKITTLAARAADQNLQDAFGLLTVQHKPRNDTSETVEISNKDYDEAMACLKDCHEWLLALGY